MRVEKKFSYIITKLIVMNNSFPYVYFANSKILNSKLEKFAKIKCSYGSLVNISFISKFLSKYYILSLGVLYTYLLAPGQLSPI